MSEIQNKPQSIEAWLAALGAPSADRDYKPGHERVLNLIEFIKQQGFTFYQPKLRIRIAGSNGKGSTANFLAKALQANGYNVGLYTSPHIVSFHERIQVNGQSISQEDLISLMEIVMPLALEVGASYFETATVLGLLYFSQQQVDVEILEAGVGAKLDATTAVPADIGLLTPVGLDHQEWLGDTLEEIARDKMYVFQGCVTQISAPQNELVFNVVQQRIPNIQVALMFDGSLKAQGDHQFINAGLAYAALQAIDQLPVDLSVAKHAISQTSIAGRLESVSCCGHSFVLDAAHNEHAVQALLPTLQNMPKFDVVFLATRDDRDLSMCVGTLREIANKVVVMTGKKKHDYINIEQALDDEISHLKHGNILVLGSFVTLSKTLAWMKAQKNKG